MQKQTYLVDLCTIRYAIFFCMVQLTTREEWDGVSIIGTGAVVITDVFISV